MDEAVIKQAIADGVKEGVKAALEAELKPFYIDREKHFEQHKVLARWMEWMDQCQCVVLKTIVGVIVITGLGLMIAGFAIKNVGK